MQNRIALTVADGIADVRLARPERMNALDLAMFEAMAEALTELAAMPALRAVVLSGEGRGFCAGLDTAMLAAGAPGIDIAAVDHGPANLVQHAAWGWRVLAVPVIAALHGAAIGGGLQIAAGADIRIAHPATRLSIRELHWGIVPDMAGNALWRGTVRDDHLRELTYTARELDAAEGERLGLVTRLADDPLAAAHELARTIAGRSPDAIRAAKRLHALARDGGAAPIMAAEREAQAGLLAAARRRPDTMADRGAGPG